MLFHSLSFLLFFPVVTLVFFIVPKRFRYLWLLAASYYFYMSWNPKYALLILTSTAITYFSGILLGNERIRTSKGGGKWVVALGIATNIAILVVFKYAGFLLNNVNKALGVLHITAVELPFDILLPVGISFYTFQALSYVIDVYRGNTAVERNFFRYALFVSFFPQLVAGPIERSGNLLNQLRRTEEIRWDGKRITEGLKTMVYGFFLKLVIADRAAMFVNEVFENHFAYGSTALVLGVVLFAVQIYCDFNSYSLIAIGSAKVLGFTLMENFNAPYLSRSVAEFWRRWHISLSTWFRDYLYIPLGGSRCSKRRTLLNIMIVFALSGLWHGAGFSFIVWGMLNGLYQVTGAVLRPLKDKVNAVCHTKVDSFGYRFVQTLVTFVLINFSWIFFRCENLTQALDYIKRMCTRIDPWNLLNGSPLSALPQTELSILLVAIAFLLTVDCIKYYRHMDLHEALATQCVWLRWSVYILLITAILVFGIYGPGFVSTEFIYFQF